MKTTVAVDANIILSALLGGKARIILFDNRYRFITTDFNINEVVKYISKLSKELGISERETNELLHILPIKNYLKDFYKNKLIEAIDLLKNIDIHDSDLLALALKEGALIWSEDKHFQKIKNLIKVIKTEDLI